MNGKITVGITQGDSNGIGYEVIIKALSDERCLDMFTPVIYGSSKIFGFYKKQLHNIGQINTNVISSASEARPKTVNIVNCLSDDLCVSEPGRSTKEAAKSGIIALDTAIKEAKAGLIDVLITAPINKKAITDAGFQHPGHTEYLQKEFDCKDVAMIMVCDRLKIAVVTGHIQLKDVASKITTAKILTKLRVVKAALERDFCIDNPKIAVLGLNPHCGDGGLLGEEELNSIIPAVKKANEENIMAFGPFSPDGFFGMGNYEKYDAVLAMYHDQGLIPFKSIAFEDGVNYTAGLPIVRTSPDHGTAYDMAGRDEADPRSMMASIYTAIDIARNRIRYDKLKAGRLEIDDEAGKHKAGTIE